MSSQGDREEKLRNLATLSAAFFPGALAGTQLAGLLFFLNPHLPFEPAPILRGVTFFGVLLGFASVLLLAVLSRGDGSRIQRWFPWSLTLVLAVACASAWVHASLFAFYLPSGINRRLLKAAIWLTLATVICFYTGLVHVLKERPYGRRSRLLITLTALATIYVVMERREAFKPRLGPAPRATTFAGTARPQLLVVGLEAATLDAILPLAEQGRLPFFSRMLAEGANARLKALQPARRLPLWTTLASGKLPFEHGVVGEHRFGARYLGTEPLRLLPVGFSFRRWGVWGETDPVDGRARQSLALWEILARLDLNVALVGWPLIATAQDPPDAEIGLSESFFGNGRFEDGGRGPAWPDEVVDRARLFLQQDVDPAQAARFGPDPPADLSAALAADLWRQDLSFFLLEQHPEIDAFFLLLPGLRDVSQQFFGGYSAVRFEGVQEPSSVRSAQMLEAYYTFLDEVLAGLWERSREPRLLVAVSVHGVEDLDGWQKAWQMLRRQPPGPGFFDDGPDGFLIALGEGIRPETRLGTAQLVDLVPTLLYGLGFPVARDLEGAVLTDAFETTFLARQPLTFLPSYETFAARPGDLPRGEGQGTKR